MNGLCTKICAPLQQRFAKSKQARYLQRWVEKRLETHNKGTLREKTGAANHLIDAGFLPQTYFALKKRGVDQIVFSLDKIKERPDLFGKFLSCLVKADEEMSSGNHEKGLSICLQSLDLLKKLNWIKLVSQKFH